MNKKNSIAWPIAICADSDIADKIEAILHINRFLPNNNENSYIEIGVLVSRKEYNNISRNFNINITLPFKIYKTDFIDIKDRLCDGKTINMIFNEETHLDKNKSSFRLKEYDLGNIELCNTTINNDTSITMSVKEQQKNSYFRFRVTNIKDKISDTMLSDTMANPFIKAIKITGISINLDRRFTKQIDNKIKFKEINTFIILDSTTELLEKNKSIKSFRVLEDDLWREYIGYDTDLNMTVYQFKESNLSGGCIESYQLFLKSLHHKSSKFEKYKFLLFVVLVAIASNFIYGLIK